MTKYIDISINSIKLISRKRLLNIFKINRKYIFQILFLNGFDTSNNGNNINWNIVNDDLFHNKEFNRILYLNDLIKEHLINTNESSSKNKLSNY